MITSACGKVIAARNEKNKASKTCLSFKKRYNMPIPTNETIQYTNAFRK
jgi:hypothetical protein